MSRRLLYDLAGADPDLRFSPYCWRTRMALAHKGLSVETIPWRFTDKDVIAFSGQERVPVLIDGRHVVSDSWAIAVYLEKAYPRNPSLFGGKGGISSTRFVNAFADAVIQPRITRLIVSDVLEVLDEKDVEYFRKTREERLGKPLKEAILTRESDVVDFRILLQPLRLILSSQSFLGGESPMYADYILFGGFQWSRCTSRFELLSGDDPICAWRERLLDAFDGLARNAKTRD